MSKTTDKPPRKANPALLRPVQPDEVLAKIVGSEPIPRSEITKRIWDYIKKHGLQDPAKKTNIKADAALEAVFGGKGTVTMFEMTKLVSGHIKVIAIPANLVMTTIKKPTAKGKAPAAATKDAASLFLDPVFSLVEKSVDAATELISSLLARAIGIGASDVIMKVDTKAFFVAHRVDGDIVHRHELDRNLLAGLDDFLLGLGSLSREAIDDRISVAGRFTLLRAGGRKVAVRYERRRGKSGDVHITLRLLDKTMLDPEMLSASQLLSDVTISPPDYKFMPAPKKPAAKVAVAAKGKAPVAAAAKKPVTKPAPAAPKAAVKAKPAPVAKAAPAKVAAKKPAAPAKAVKRK